MYCIKLIKSLKDLIPLEIIALLIHLLIFLITDDLMMYFIMRNVH